MIIVKIVCIKCGKKYKSHGRHPVNPQFTYEGAFKDLILTPEEVSTLSGVTDTDIELFEDLYPYGVLVLNYVKRKDGNPPRTVCGECGGPLKAYAMLQETRKIHKSPREGGIPRKDIENAVRKVKDVRKNTSEERDRPGDSEEGS